jgi:hypothetical protein
MQSTKIRFEFFLVLCLVLTYTSCANASSQTVEPNSSGNDAQKLAPLLSVVNASGMSIWIEYHDSCLEQSHPDLPLQLRFSPNEQMSTTDALATVRAMLLANENLSINLTSPGIINVSTANVWSPLLKVRLNKLKLRGPELYNPGWAISAAITASRASWENLHATPWATWESLLGTPPSKGRPHLKKSSSYTTLNDLVIDVSRTFPGVFVYKECTLPDSSHVFDVNYYQASEMLP